MSKTWGQLLGLVQPAPKTYSRVTPSDPVCPSLLYGVELEIENVPDWMDMLVSGIRGEADGSLRNSGREFITQPMSYSNLSHCLNMFFSKNKFNATNYSDRTSIHVHTNCQDLTVEQITTIAFVYQVVESLLFNWVDHTRADNIFCVPWSQTAISYQTFNGIENTSVMRWKRWQKYTALNLLPLYEHGTIEWRHMNGHCNVKKILEWCQLIGCIFNYAKNTPLVEAQNFLSSLNTTSLYNNILEAVFGPRAQAFFDMPNYQRLLEEGVLNMKYSMDVGLEAKRTKKSSFSYFDDIEARDMIRQEELVRIIEAQRRVGDLTIAPVDNRNAQRPVQNFWTRIDVNPQQVAIQVEEDE